MEREREAEIDGTREVEGARQKDGSEVEKAGGKPVPRQTFI